MYGFLLSALLIAVSTVASAGHVNGYIRSNGTYVQGYERSSPNTTRSDNYGYSYGKSYSNPYTRDRDQDGTPNRYDKDDNNNSVSDDNDRCQYCLRP